MSSPLLILQSGGPTAVLNTTLAAAVTESQNQLIPRILGSLHGIEGLLHVSPQDRIDADLVGTVAVRAALAGDRGVMVSLRPVASTVAYDLIPLARVCAGAGAERPIPEDWLADSDLAVSNDFLNYARPLIGPLNDYAIPFT
jgi:hypothetical protein